MINSECMKKRQKTAKKETEEQLVGKVTKSKAALNFLY